MMLFAALGRHGLDHRSALAARALRVNEIIATLLLNYVAFNFLLHLLYGAWLDPKDDFPHSPQFRAFERLPELGFGASAARW